MRTGTLAVAGLTAALLAAAPAGAYEGGAVANGGTISGTVAFEGDPPAPEELNVTKDNAVCGEKKTSNALLVGPDKGIKNVVVRVTDIAKGKPMEQPASNPVFDQKGCEYHPHVLLFPAGSTIDILNSDGILHNVHTTSTANPAFNQAQPKFKKKIEKTIEKPEMPIKVVCDAHGWMLAWWISQEHPYYALTDEKGAFEMKDVPPGDYQVELWHEVLGKHTEKVTVEPGGTMTLTVQMAKK